MLARLIFAAVNFAARNGLSELRHESSSTTKELARATESAAKPSPIGTSAAKATHASPAITPYPASKVKSI
jgi:hypothetical protein